MILFLKRPFDETFIIERLRQSYTITLKSKEIWKDQLKFLKPLIFKTITYSTLIALFTSGSSYFSMKIIKLDGVDGSLIQYSLLFFLFNVFAHFLNFQNAKTRCEVRLLSESRLIQLISQKIFNLSFESMSKQSSGNLKVLLQSDVKSFSLLWDQAFRNLIPALMAFLIVTPFIWINAGFAGLFSIFVMMLFLPLSYLLNKWSTHLKFKSLNQLDEVTTLQGEWVKNIRLVRALSMSSVLEASIKKSLKKYLTTSTVNHFMACLIYGFSVSWWIVSILSFFCFIHFRNQSIDLPHFFVFLWLLTYLSYSFVHLPSVFRSVAEVIPALKRMQELLNETEISELYEKKLKEEPYSPIEIGCYPVSIAFNDVSFSYQQKEIFSSLNVQLDLNKKNAIIGSVGSGKTTFLRLIGGEVKPTRGSIEVTFSNGETLNIWSEKGSKWIQSSIAVVPQDAYISADTLEKNITLTDDGLEMNPFLLSCIEDAQLQKDLSLFAKGLQESIGESGVNLSGGQRARVSLARALYSKRELLLLDDPLSALDLKTEKKIMNTLLKNKNHFLLVTHRIREIDACDEVIVLEAGKMIERGTPAELKKLLQSHFLKILNAYKNEEHLDGNNDV